MKKYDLSKILGNEHSGKWVALDSERTKVVAYSDTFKDLESKIGNKKVVYIKALQKGVSYSF